MISPLRFVCFNIRMETNEPDPADNWSNRRDGVAAKLASSGADIIGLQEVLPEQLTFLARTLGPLGYQHVGTGRGIDGDDEASPIFFKRDVFELRGSQQRWLSDTPSVPGSRLEGAGCPRVVTAALLNVKAYTKDVFVFCCHLDHHGMVSAARRFSNRLPIQARQAEIMLEQIDHFCVSPSAPRIVLGDFNSWRGAGAHAVLSERGYKDASVASGELDDTPTFTGFRSGNIVRRVLERLTSAHIDWIFASGGVALSNYRVDPSVHTATDGTHRNLSDHRMIMSDVSFDAIEG